MNSYRELFMSNDFSDTFSDRYIDYYKFYCKVFQNIPVSHWIHEIDKDKVLAYIKTEYASCIHKVLVETGYSRTEKKNVVYNALILLEGERMIRLHQSTCGILMPGHDDAFLQDFTDRIRKFKNSGKKRTFEINLITMGNNSFDITGTEVRRTKLDLGLH